MFSTIEISVSIDDELVALLADYAAFIGEDSGTVVDQPVLDPNDPAVVMDPMASGDPVVFTGETAPADLDPGADPDAVPAADSTEVAADQPVPVDVDVDVDLPNFEGFFQVDDGGFDLDLTLLEVGRAFGQSGFIDLP